MLFGTDARFGAFDAPSYPAFLDWRDQNRSFESMAAYVNRSGSLGVGDEAILAGGKRISASTFDVLGVRPIIGRAFGADEEPPGADRVVILSEGLWRQYFGGAPSALGQTLRIDEAPYTIVGVMPASFHILDEQEEHTAAAIRSAGATPTFA